MPGDAASNSQSFSSALCGAWSVAMQSMVPSASASRSASRSSFFAQRRVDLAGGVVAEQRLVGEGR